jgi:hypothetical protein
MFGFRSHEFSFEKFIFKDTFTLSCSIFIFKMAVFDLVNNGVVWWCVVSCGVREKIKE